jgi:hypothetical protein
VAGFSIAQENEDETPIGGLFSPNLVELEGFPVETDALLQIKDIEIVVCKAEFHDFLSFSSSSSSSIQPPTGSLQ